MIPVWLHVLAICFLALGGVCALILTKEVIRHSQSMAIMNIVWPVTALFGTLGVMWQYFTYRQKSMHGHAHEHKHAQENRIPFSISVANGTLHCGAGCMLGDIVAEWLMFFFPAIAVWFGWHGIFNEKMYAVWVADFLCAYLLGVVFQYYGIVPMRHLSFGAGVWAAIKADTLSLAAWQVGMYGFMAFVRFIVFGAWLGAPLHVDSAEFWFMMQIAMLCGFVTAYPVNWWLLRIGIKETM